jgi:predicted homoserine dehydrogenase-like protein
MIIVDQALKRRQSEGRPIRVGLIGAGYMGRGIALQILTSVPGMKLVAIYNRHISDARLAYSNAGIEKVQAVETAMQLETAMNDGIYAVTENALAICEAEGIDAIIEVTGTIDFGAQVVLAAAAAGKHIILMNAELDATLGPILKVYADRAGVLLSTSDGDQPGVIMNLLRWVQSIGFKPVLAGNMKGLQDPYRTPETQKEFAARNKQKPAMVTSFADGTKISMEMAVVANATGFRVGRRGMYGPRCAHVNDAPGLFPVEQMLGGGLVDYTLGAEPAPGVFVIGHNENPLQQQYMNYYKMGDGPFYVFYTPYHLCHVEAPLTVARVVLFGDVAATPLGAPVCEVVAVAKRNLDAGEILDGLGGFCCYGVLENTPVSRNGNLLPLGLAEGCRLATAVPMDRPLTFDDVEMPVGRLCDTLWEEQRRFFQTGAGHSAEICLQMPEWQESARGKGLVRP